jgi:hypothetical protein
MGRLMSGRIVHINVASTRAPVPSEIDQKTMLEHFCAIQMGESDAHHPSSADTFMAWRFFSRDEGWDF